MLQNTLKRILNNTKDIEKLIDIFSQYEIGDYLYPSVIKNELKLSDSKADEVLKEIEKNGYLKLCYILDCPYCHNEIDIFDDFQELISQNYCGNCNKKFSPLDHALIGFKVLKK